MFTNPAFNQQYKEQVLCLPNFQYQRHPAFMFPNQMNSFNLGQSPFFVMPNNINIQNPQEVPMVQMAKDINTQNVYSEQNSMVSTSLGNQNASECQESTNREDFDNATEEDSELSVIKFENKDLSQESSSVTGQNEEDEDELIIALGKKYKNDWKRVSKKIYKMRGKKMGPTKLRDHFKSLTKGTLPKRIKFTHNEDLLIAKYFDQYGCLWDKIASHFTTRTPMMIKNRYYSFIRKKNLQEDLLNETSNPNQKIAEPVQKMACEVIKQNMTQEIKVAPKDEIAFMEMKCNRITSMDLSLAFHAFGPEEQLHHTVTPNMIEKFEDPNDFLTYQNPMMMNKDKSITLDPSNYVWNFNF